MFVTLGIDTSNYTTSAAVYRSEGASMNAGRLLDVPEGALGLRQSDALFSHVKRLPEQFLKLEQAGMLKDIMAIGASTRPRAVEGSYMPCFLAGSSQAQVMAVAMGVPFFAFSHQQGHIAAACWSAGRMDLLDHPHLAWHLSGGTTELLLVEPLGYNVTARCIGGTSDISAGQLIDRTGKLLNIPFPAGKGLDALSREAEENLSFKVKVKDCVFSLSGVENKVKQMQEQGKAPAAIARFTLNTIAEAVSTATKQARVLYPDYPVLFSGGVASNSLLREVMTSRWNGIFASPEFSTDNAMGVAVLAARALEQGALE